MEQTIEENVETEEISEQEDSSELEKTTEEKSILRKVYNSKSLDNDKYEQNPNYKKTESKNASKKSPQKKSGLEQKISNIIEEAEKSDKDVAEYLSFKLSQHPLYFESEEKESDEDSTNGSVVIVCHKNPETGKLEFLVEQKTVEYPEEEARGKFSFVGGAIKTKESSYNAAMRETLEEVVGSAAYIIIKQLKENPHKYATKWGIIDGQLAYTDFWVVEIKQKNEWEIVKRASSREGSLRTLTQEDAIKYNSYFAFGYGPIIREFINENSKVMSLLPKFIPFTYNDSFIPSIKSTTLLNN